MERLASLKMQWELHPPDDHRSDIQDEILEEFAVAAGFYRQAAMMIARTRNGPIFVTSWDTQMNDIHRSLEDAAVWVNRIKIHWPAVSLAVQ